MTITDTKGFPPPDDLLMTITDTKGFPSPDDLLMTITDSKGFRPPPQAQQAAHDPPEALAKLPVLTTSDLETRSAPLPIEIEPQVRWPLDWTTCVPLESVIECL